MTINGLDISHYQEDQDRLIQWSELAKDERQFKFIWIKASEGEILPRSAYAYPVGVFRRQMLGAGSIGLMRGPYHFYYYHLPLGNGQYYQLSPYKQADALRQAATGYEGEISPLADLEDPYIYRPKNFLAYSNTEEANLAIAFARKLCNHIRQYMGEIKRLFVKRPAIYSSAWWWNPWAQLVQAHAPDELEWVKEYDFYLADYSRPEPLACIGAGRVIAHQYTSTPTIPVRGMTNAPYNVDLARWMLSDAEFIQWAGDSGGTTMAAIYNNAVPQAERARVLTLEPSQTLAAGTAVGDLGIDAVILPMGSMHNWDGSHWKTQAEATFPGRFTLFDGAGIPVLGRFAVDAGSMIVEQHGDVEFKNRLIRDNFILPFLINAWHVGPWTWDSVFAKQGKWRQISALILSEVEQIPYNGVKPNGYWQVLVWDYLVDHIRTLMGAGQLPTVPIICYTGGWWLRQYTADFGVELANDQPWLYLHLGQWVRYSTATFNTLAEIFAFPPDDTFTFKIVAEGSLPAWNVPDGYGERVLMHEWTGQAQKCRQIVDALGNPTEVSLSLWNDTPAKMRVFLGYTGPEEPPVEPLPVLEQRVELLEKQMDNLLAVVDGIRALLNSSGG